MFKRYRALQESQLRWIRDNPVKYVALNATLVVVFIGYIEYQERREARKFENTKTPTQ